ncbi:YbaB/EbfC family nucleoid-associated protein [Amycolatopsis pithecellobii]|uniref:YbaB/EbfC family DNA-binding protein n=1 Tax=Amycolatopsis pithecellobii TaxID=664692 RepID=A0A6N7ZCY9_9PSEU|nr:YbaB/EbfC family nucleoid-associated protein [Amycolatopsis pithecellobii]MTD59539.1 YbaB/EbfC family DNA-binding protein [Amycolatopsis pithecellobii]
MSPEEWLANFESKIADVKAKTAEFQENLEAAGATETSKDGSITVTVAPNGALTGLRLAESARQGPALAEEILRLARKAQRAAAVHVAEAFAPLGADSEAMHMVTGYIPPEEPEEEAEPPAPTYRFTDEGEPPAPPQRPTQRPQPRPRHARPSDDEDDDFGDNSYLRRD